MSINSANIAIERISDLLHKYEYQVLKFEIDIENLNNPQHCVVRDWYKKIFKMNHEQPQQVQIQQTQQIQQFDYNHQQFQQFQSFHPFDYNTQQTQQDHNISFDNYDMNIIESGKVDDFVFEEKNDHTLNTEQKKIEQEEHSNKEEQSVLGVDQIDKNDKMVEIENNDPTKEDCSYEINKKEVNDKNNQQIIEEKNEDVLDNNFGNILDVNLNEKSKTDDHKDRSDDISNKEQELIHEHQINEEKIIEELENTPELPDIEPIVEPVKTKEITKEIVIEYAFSKKLKELINEWDAVIHLINEMEKEFESYLDKLDDYDKKIIKSSMKEISNIIKLHKCKSKIKVSTGKYKTQLTLYYYKNSKKHKKIIEFKSIYKNEILIYISILLKLDTNLLDYFNTDDFSKMNKIIVKIEDKRRFSFYYENYDDIDDNEIEQMINYKKDQIKIAKDIIKSNYKFKSKTLNQIAYAIQNITNYTDFDEILLKKDLKIKDDSYDVIIMVYIYILNPKLYIYKNSPISYLNVKETLLNRKLINE